MMASSARFWSLLLFVLSIVAVGCSDDEVGTPSDADSGDVAADTNDDRTGDVPDDPSEDVESDAQDSGGDPIDDASDTTDVGADPVEDAADADADSGAGDALDDTGDLGDEAGDAGLDADSGPLDSDGDGVLDGEDVCPGSDDRVDLNDDGVPDCSQNLLANGGFDDDLGGWEPQGSTPVWDGTVDAAGLAASGSLRFAHDGTSVVSVSQRVAVVEGTAYGFYGQYFNPIQGNAESIRLRLRWVAVSGETESAVETVEHDLVLQGSWTDFAFVEVAPDGADFIRVELRLNVDTFAEPSNGFVDNVMALDVDSDGDGVADAADLCDFEDDKVDLDDDGVADCAQSLVDGTFDTEAEVGEWDGASVLRGWSTADQTGYSESGSTQFFRQSIDGATWRCVEVESATTYRFQYAFRLPSGTPGAGTNLNLLWFSTADCSGGFGNIAGTFHTETDAWTVVSEDHTSPADALSVQFRVAVTTPAEFVEMFLDNASMYVAPTE